MIDNKVVRLPDSDYGQMVDAARETSDMAREGRLACVFVVGVTPEGALWTAYGGSIRTEMDATVLTGAMQVHEARIMSTLSQIEDAEADVNEEANADGDEAG